MRAELMDRGVDPYYYVVDVVKAEDLERWHMPTSKPYYCSSKVVGRKWVTIRDGGGGLVIKALVGSAVEVGMFVPFNVLARPMWTDRFPPLEERERILRALGLDFVREEEF